MKRLRENQALFEERQLFGIRKLKLGVASVAIAAAFSLGTASGHTTVAAESLTSVEPIDGAVMVKSGLPTKSKAQMSYQKLLTLVILLELLM